MAILLSTVCILGGMATGCTGSAPAVGNATESGANEGQGTDGALDGRSNAENLPDTDNVQNTQSDLSQNPQENSGGRWQVFDQDTAAAVDADFTGQVWKIEDTTFYIVEVKTVVLEDGSLVSSHPSSNAEIPDSDLIQVVYDENTHFYIRSIYDGGARYEDKDSGAQDLEEYMSVDLKGSFKDNIFYANEVRLMKVM